MKRWLAALLILTLAFPALAEELPDPEPMIQEVPEDEPIEEPVYEETPVEENPAEDEPAEEAPAEDNLIGDNLTGNNLTDDNPIDDDPIEDGPIEDGLADDGLIEDGLIDDGLIDDGLIEDGGEAYTAAQIERIQQWLIALKYLEAGHATGEYDADTAAAVAAFQSDNGLEPTGECDEATYALLKDLGQAALDAQGGQTGDDDDDDTIDVSQVQAWLLALGYLEDSQRTGEYDEATDAAVRRFQQDNGLEATGECDPATLALLASLADAAGREETGYTAEQIRQIQTWLTALGYLQTGDDTGVLDETTTAAIKAFQTDVQLEVTGVLDESAYAKLKELGEAAANANGNGQSGGSRSSSSSGSGGSASGAGTQDERLNGVTPGTALTSTHSSGSKDTTLYGSIGRNGSLRDLGISLRIGQSSDDLVRVSYNAAVRDDTLALEGSEQRPVQSWTFDGLTLRTLARSGIDRMTFSGVAFDTEAIFDGPVYDALRAQGCTENTFHYTVTVEDGAAHILLDIHGGRYTAELNAFGAYTLTEEAN